MKCTAVYIPVKESPLTETVRLLYKSLLGRLFYVPPGYQPQKPILYSLPHGVWLQGRRVYTILVTTSFYDMLKTDADAVLANFYLIPSTRTLHKISSAIKKPVIISVRNSFMTSLKLAEAIKMIENAGLAGIYAGRRVPLSKLKNICSGCSVPVFAASGPGTVEITSKISAGVFALCIAGKNASPELMATIRKLFPVTPVIAVCNRSEKQIQKSIKSGMDAVIFKPCVPFETDWADY